MVVPTPPCGGVSSVVIGWAKKRSFSGSPRVHGMVSSVPTSGLRVRTTPTVSLVPVCCHLGKGHVNVLPTCFVAATVATPTPSGASHAATSPGSDLDTNLHSYACVPPASVVAIVTASVGLMLTEIVSSSELLSDAAVGVSCRMDIVPVAVATYLRASRRAGP